MSNKQLHTFYGMQFVKDEYTKYGRSDSDFAEYMNEHFKEANPKLEWSHAHVRQYRQALKIPNNAPRGPDAKVQEAKKLFEALLLHCGASMRADLKQQVTEYIS